MGPKRSFPKRRYQRRKIRLTNPYAFLPLHVRRAGPRRTPLDTPHVIARSYLYVPADQAAKLAKAMTCGADAVICDLEDAVAVVNKDGARRLLEEFLRNRAVRPVGGPLVWVRINDGGRGLDDVNATIDAAGGGLDGVVVPKATADTLHAVDQTLTDSERRFGQPLGAIPMCALLESASAILDARVIASSPRVVRLAIGEADLRAELGTELTPGDEHEHLLARQMLVMASAAVGLDAPTGPVSTDFHDLDAFRASTIALKRMGFRSRAAIHPSQVPVINDVFTPTDAEFTSASRLIELFDASVARGDGVCTDDDGRMIDEAIVRWARRTMMVRADP
jgi:citrate lyase subunit beta / citryl-CoA lyase